MLSNPLSSLSTKVEQIPVASPCDCKLGVVRPYSDWSTIFKVQVVFHMGPLDKTWMLLSAFSTAPVFSMDRTILVAMLYHILVADAVAHNSW